jgi:hypothetical protein
MQETNMKKAASRVLLPKCSATLRGVISQKKELLVATAVRTSEPTDF